MRFDGIGTIGIGEHPQEGIEMSNLHSAGNPILSETTHGGPSVTGDVVVSTSSAANTVLLDVAATPLVLPKRAPVVCSGRNLFSCVFKPERNDCVYK